MQTQNRRRSWALVFALVCWLFAPGIAHASTFEAGVAQYSFGSGICFPTLGSSPASASWTSFSNGVGNANASGVAEGGTLRGFAAASSSGNSTIFSNQIGGCFAVETLIDDVIISGPGTTVSTQVSADLSGIIDSIAPLGSTALGATKASLGTPLSPGAKVSFDTCCSDAIVDTTLTTGAFDAPVNVPFAIALTLRGRSVATSTAPANSSNTNDFASTLNFTTGGPVFALPPGYTANSVSGDIVDNVFVGITPAVPALGGPAFVVLFSLLAALGVRPLATRAS
jgi:hypothetical protein